MKKLFISIAVMALCLTACDKESKETKPESNYDKTEVILDYEFSEDYISLYDITVEGKDFEGKDLSVKVESKGKFSFETTKENAETTIRVSSVKKAQLPQIESRIYTISKKFNGIIRAKVKDKEAYSSMQSFDFAGGTSSSSLKGDSLMVHPEFLDRKAFDKTIRLSIATEGNSVSISAQQVE